MDAFWAGTQEIPSPVAGSADTYTQEVETGGLEGRGYPWLHSKFEASLSYTRP